MIEPLELATHWGAPLTIKLCEYKSMGLVEIQLHGPGFVSWSVLNRDAATALRDKLNETLSACAEPTQEDAACA